MGAGVARGAKPGQLFTHVTDTGDERAVPLELLPEGGGRVVRAIGGVLECCGRGRRVACVEHPRCERLDVMLCHIRLPARWQGLQAFGARAIAQRRIVSHRVGAARRGQEDGIIRARAHSVEDEVADRASEDVVRRPSELSVDGLNQAPRPAQMQWQVGLGFAWPSEQHKNSQRPGLEAGLGAG
eukprot:4369044-Prymnesium_polylepis.1